MTTSISPRMSDQHTKWMDNLGVVATSQGVRRVMETSGGASGSEAKRARAERLALNNFAFNSNRQRMAAGPRLVKPKARFTNAPRIAA